MGEDERPVAGPEQWDQEISQIAQLIQATSGWEQKAAEMRMKDAQEGRANAYKIAQLQSETSRYGVDAQRQTAMAQLKQRAHEFELTHGLDVAKAYTAFSSTPDMMWARNDFLGAMGRVGQGLSPQPLSQSPSPQPKTWGDFQALSKYQGPGQGAGSGGGSSATAPIPTSADPGGRSGGGGAAPQASAAGGGTDPRITAASAVMKAMPPSATQGNDDQDWAALRAIESLYFGGQPNTVAKLGEPRRKIAQAGLARLGYDPALVEWEYRRGLPGQGNVRAA